jgi:hypothetical protein
MSSEGSPWKPNAASVVAALSAFALAFVLASACESSLVREARKAESDRRVIGNDIMQEMYPASFRKGYPEYLERDFEAGADFICDEIEQHYGKDLCAEPKIKWRK